MRIKITGGPCYLMNHLSILSVQSYIAKPKSHSLYLSLMVLMHPACLYQSHQTLLNRSSCHTSRCLINYPIILSVQSYIEKPISHSPYIFQGVDVPACIYQSHQTLLIDLHVPQPDLLEPRRVVSDDVTKASHRRI